jgi:hypothetical protein
MSDTKLAVSWGDVLLLAAVAVVGSGICALSAAVVAFLMTPAAPKESALGDAMHVPQLEQRLATAREDRGFILAQRRELAMQRSRSAAAQRMNEDDIRALGPQAPREKNVVRDSLVRAGVVLARARRADSLMALSLDAMKSSADDSVAVRERAFEIAKDSVEAQLRMAQMQHAGWKILWTALGAILGVGILLLSIHQAMKPRNGEPAKPRARFVIGPALLIIALVFMHQVGGAMFTLGVVSAAATLFLLFTLTRVTR